MDVVSLLLLQGCSLRCRWLDTDQAFTMQLKRSAPASFISAAKLMTTAKSDFSTFAVPVSRNYPAIDAAVSPCVWIQVMHLPQSKQVLRNVLQGLQLPTSMQACGLGLCYSCYSAHGMLLTHMHQSTIHVPHATSMQIDYHSCCSSSHVNGHQLFVLGHS